jgi:hypothetical protein
LDFNRPPLRKEIAMRVLMVYAALMALVVVGAEAQDGVTPAKDAVTDATIIDTCGGRLAKMFAHFGTPQDVWVTRGDTPAEDDVLCAYGAYGFRVRSKMVRCCFFWTDWKGPIRGIKIGDSREDVVKVLGKAPVTVKDKNGIITSYGYHMKDVGVEFYTDFDKDGKVKRVEIDPLD